MKNKIETPGELMYLDISSMKQASGGGSKHWILLVDRATDFKISWFVKKKSDQIEVVSKYISNLKASNNIQVKELKFIIQVLETMKVNVKLPITVHIDNVGAIFMATNHTSSDRTKHVDVRYHFVREFIEDGVVKIKFIRSKEMIQTYLQRMVIWSCMTNTRRN